MNSFFLFFTIFSVVILYGQLSLKIKTRKESDLLENLTVVIPFRNEFHHLRNLLDFIKNQSKFPAEIIFVNDHSEDESIVVIEQMTNFPVKISLLSTENEGKKFALRKGISQAKTAFILTLDADVELPSDYFQNLATLEIGDAFILPVKIVASSPLFNFFKLDYYYLFALNNGIHFLERPFSASGANFLFRKEKYEQFLSTDRNQSVSSGDDQYFVHFLVKNKAEIQLCTDERFAVKTALPITFREILQQRIRWIKKGASVQSFMPVLMGIIGLVYHLGCLILAFFFPQQIIEILLTKILFDALVFYPYGNRLGDTPKIKEIIFFSLFYPFWMLFIAVASFVITPKWKGRKISIKKS